MYIPVMFLSLAPPVLVAVLISLISRHLAAGLLPISVFLVCGLHLAYLWAVSNKRIKREKDWFEMPLEPGQKVQLREFVIEIARRWDTPRPEDIRLSAESAAHVYETKKGKRILVIGGMALAALSKTGLGAVLAHELTHFAGGDTAQYWENLAGFRCMNRLAAEFRLRPFHLLDPAVWPLALFHFVVEIRYARESREREFRCDARSAEHAGPEATAAALIYIHVVDQMPWANIMDVLALAGAVGAASGNVFSEQAHRAITTHPDDWADATKKEMRKNTKLLDDHPCLRERLEAIDATAKQGLRYLLADDSPSARTLIKDWPAVERKLSVKITSAYQVWREYRYGWGGLTRSEPED
jgi:Zn-dependent protease with chaperone function